MNDGETLPLGDRMASTAFLFVIRLFSLLPY